MLTSVNSYSSISSRKGISGLASGMDIDALVEQMSGNTRSKISSQLMKKQLALMKQEAYREISSKMINLSNKYFSYSSKGTNNILSDSFFNSSSIKTVSDYFKVSGDPIAAKNMTIKEIKLAKNASFTSDATLPGEKIVSAKIDTMTLSRLTKDSSLKIRVGNDVSEIKIDESFKFTEGKTDAENVQELLTHINGKAPSGVSFSLDADNKITMTNNSNSEVAILGGTSDLIEGLGLKYSGGTAAAGGSFTTTNTTFDSLLGNLNSADSLVSGKTIKFKYGDVEKEIKVDDDFKFDSHSTEAQKMDKLIEHLNSKMNIEGVNGEFSVADGKISIKTDSSDIEIIDGGTLTAKLGLVNGNKATLGTDFASTTEIKNSDLYKLNNDSISFKYGDETINIAIDKDYVGTTANDLVSYINEQLNKEGASTKDKIYLEIGIDNKITFTNSGDKEFKIMGGTESLMGGLGLTGGAAANGGSIVFSNTTSAGELYIGLENQLSGSTLTINFNGVDKKITFNESDKEKYDTLDEFKEYMQTKMDNAFGSNKVKIELIDKTLSFSAVDQNSVLTINSSDKIGILGENGILGIKPGTNNRLSYSSTLADLKVFDEDKDADGNGTGKYTFEINGFKKTYDKTTLLGDVINNINKDTDSGVEVTFSNTLNRFTVVAKEEGATGNGAMNTSSYGENIKKLFGTPTATMGEDAVMKIDIGGNEVTVQRPTNSFNLDGVNFELTKATETGFVPVKLNVDSNTDQLFDKLKEFVKEYNEIIDIGTKKTREKYDRKYPPLTAEEKKEMSEDDIKLWEEKSRVGILQNDQYVTSILSEMRSAICNMVGGESALSKIGIAPKAFAWEQNGKLEIDEEKLRKAISEDPEGIKKLFLTKPRELTAEEKAGKSEKEIRALTYKVGIETGGISTRLNLILNKNVQTVGGDDGVLIALAGTKDDSSMDDNTISSNIKSIDSNLEKLKVRLQSEEKRLYAKFTAMEKYISQMNQQSAWLSQQLGS